MRHDAAGTTCGSVDTIARTLEAMSGMLNTDSIVPWMGSGPIDGLPGGGELLAQQVLPGPGIELRQFQPALRADYAGTGWRELSRD